jgi:condensation domain-containing protein
MTRAESPLSDVQCQMVVNEALRGHPVYNMPFCFHIAGPLDVDALQRALTAVVARHRTLRVRYGTTTAWDAEPDATLRRVAPMRTPAGELAEDTFLAVFEPPFALARQPPLRCAIAGDGTEHWLALCVHHIAADSWSVNRIMTEVSAAYRSSVTGRALPDDRPGDYFTCPARETGPAWQPGPIARLAGAGLPIPADADFGRAVHVDLGLDATVTQRLRRLSRRHRCSVATLLATWVAGVDERRVRDGQALLWTTVAVRDTAESRNSTGPALTTVPVPIRTEGDPQTVLAANAAALAGALDHAALPPSTLLGLVGTRAHGVRAHLVDVVLNIETQRPRLALAGARVRPVRTAYRWAVHPVVWDFDVPVVGDLRGTLRLAGGLCTAADADRLAAGFRRRAELVLTA